MFSSAAPVITLIATGLSYATAIPFRAAVQIAVLLLLGVLVIRVGRALRGADDGDGTGVA